MRRARERGKEDGEDGEVKKAGIYFLWSATRTVSQTSDVS